MQSVTSQGDMKWHTNSVKDKKEAVIFTPKFTANIYMKTYV